MVDQQGSDALIHLRVPATTKARWVRESRVAGMRLTDWIIERVQRQEKKMSISDALITTQPDGDVVVVQHGHDGFDYFTMERRFTVRGAYVYQVHKNGAISQTCEGLLPTGPTLMAGDDLEKIITRTLTS